MMTDIDLLKFAAKAAKAAGLDIEFHAESGKAFDNQSRMWNPLDDDGAVLRLAVALQLTVCNEHVSAGAAYCQRGDEYFRGVDCQGDGNSEVLPTDYAATRRAIVMAAAEIGEAMQ